MFMGLVNVSVSYADDKKLFNKYNKGYKGSNAESCNKLGVIYASGDGFKQDNKKAKEFYKKSCDDGNAEGFVLLKMSNSANKIINLLGENYE